MKLRARALVATMILALLSIQVVWAATGHKEHDHAKAATLAQLHKTVLPMSVKTVDTAAAAVKAGNSEAALKELAHLKAMLMQIQRTVAQEVEPAFANVSCPILGAPIRADRVTPDLIRDYKGQKVAFCCAGCPDAWDRMNDGQKQAKLSKHMAKPAQQDHSGHQH